MADDRISVRHLVEFILRSGDIDSRTGGVPDQEAMRLGSRMHRKIQKSMGKEYQAEVPLKKSFPCGDFEITVEGRADGIFTDDAGEVTIDEIKGVLRDVGQIEKPVEVHLAQAKCYAYMYAEREKLPHIAVRMTYVNLDTEEIRYFTERYDTGTLEKWFTELLDAWRKWAVFRHDWIIKRDYSIHRMQFPFEWRTGQKRLVSAVYRTIEQKRKLFIQAPTGTGKTIAVIYPALQAMAAGDAERIFYLTAKSITGKAAQDAYQLLREKQGLAFKTVSITAKEKICLMDEPDCVPEKCPYAKGHFDRLNDALYTMLQERDSFSREDILSAAKHFQLCPYELSLEIADWTDGMIGDFNYAFHPTAKLGRFFGEGVRGDYIFLIDEAHNLVSRGREMYSAVLKKEDFLNLRKSLRGRKNASERPDIVKLSRAAGRVNQSLLALKKEGDPDRFGLSVLGTTGQLPEKLLQFCGAMEDFLDAEQDEDLASDARELYFQSLFFLDILERVDNGYLIYTQEKANGFAVKLLCVDPSRNLQECMDRAVSTILFSATLLPVDYYRKLLSAQENDYAVYAESCFRREQRKIVIGGDVSTVYRRRTPEMYRRIAAYIRNITGAKCGNYMVFFPSYRMLEDVAEVLETDDGFLPDADAARYGSAGAPEKHGGKNAEARGRTCRILRQRQDMTDSEREEFLEKFSEDGEETLIGLCVMGSVFGEGVDLQGRRLIGVVVVGTGLPQVSGEQELFRKYFDEKGSDGFRYAYICPGMNRVLQAAGRVIRTEDDAGVIALLDDRFLQGQYREMFPAEWNDAERCTLDSVGGMLSDFWKHASGR